LCFFTKVDFFAKSIIIFCILKKNMNFDRHDLLCGPICQQRLIILKQSEEEEDEEEEGDL
jgi:hypothetical protein